MVEERLVVNRMEAFVYNVFSSSSRTDHVALAPQQHAIGVRKVVVPGQGRARVSVYMCVAENVDVDGNATTEKAAEKELTANEKEMLEKALQGDVARVNQLLDLGVDIKAKDENGRTLLHLIAAQGVPDLTRTLLKMGADPNAQDAMGLTPLHMAAGYKRPDTVRAIVQAGADLSMLNNRMQTPLDLARMLLDNEPDKKFILMPNKNKEALKEIVDLLRESQQTPPEA